MMMVMMMMIIIITTATTTTTTTSKYIPILLHLIRMSDNPDRNMKKE
jgi:hypothetical protein